MPSSKGTRRNIVRDIYGERYLLTSRRLVQLDSADAKEGTPWYALNKDIRTFAPSIGPYRKDRIFVYSRSSTTNKRIVRVQVGFGAVNNIQLNGDINYQIGCAQFTLPTFTRILRNAGVKTTKKAFAAQAGA
jgi:hypothetical protein